MDMVFLLVNVISLEGVLKESQYMGSISIGQNIQGLEIGAIQCEKFNRTIEGWRGGPKFISIKGDGTAEEVLTRMLFYELQAKMLIGHLHG